jgi:lysophospholipase L1-like esterase
LTTLQEREWFIRYTRINRWPILERFPLPDDLQTEVLASMAGTTQDDVRATVASMSAAVRRDSSQLMTGGAFREAIGSLPLTAGDRVVAIGDSVTADRRGWFELLKASIELAALPDVDMVNLGLSGNTTADALERLDVVAAARPTWVLVMLGTNDARYHGPKHTYRMVAPAETERNIRALADCVTGDLAADITLITPPSGDQQRMDSFFRDAPVGWRAAELDDVATLIRGLDPTCVDVNRSVGGTVSTGLLEADGVHPSVEGQRLIARLVADRLSQVRRPGFERRSTEPPQLHRVRTESET